MALHAALAAAATMLATAFALSTYERWLARRKKHELMWTISLVLFALGSLGLWAGAAFGWGEWTFKTFYLFGAILNVPFLALGTVYLLAPERVANRCAAVVSLLAAFAAGVVVAAPVTGLIEAAVLPQGSAVFGPGPRVAAAVGSGVASLVIVGGALWSAWNLLRAHRDVRRGDGAPAGAPTDRVTPGRLALANVFIAVGTIVLGSGGALNSVADAMNAFAVSLVAGIALIFAGFLLTSTPAPLRPVEPWYPPAAGTTGTTGTSADATATGTTTRRTAADELRPQTDTRPGSPQLN